MCEVRLKDHAPFSMAVRAENDVVSWQVCTRGFWEVDDPSSFGAPGQAMDIGGNMGYFTFVLAHAGWSVHTFEPMKANQELINATLCANPDLASRVKIHYHGLGATNKFCQFTVHKNNVGNGITRCSGDKNMWWEDMANFGSDGTQFQIRNFDEVLNELQVQKLDFVKLDVEGYECEVLKGAPDFLTRFSPRLIRTEAWAYLERCGLQEYLNKFLSSGYVLSRDISCAPASDFTFGDYYACNTKK
jgi:FkbM family methyltransferase